MSDFTFLSANDVSWQDYRDLRLEALREEPRAYASTYASQKDYSDETWQERLKQSQEGKSNWMVFAGDGNKLIGMIGAYQEEKEKKENSACVVAVYVKKEFRGNGIGKLLMNSLLELLAKTGIAKVTLQVNSIQAPAVKLYERFGFQKVKSVKFDLGHGKFDKDYVMEKMI